MTAAATPGRAVARLPAFQHSEPFSLGLELELQVVGLHDYDLTQGAADLLREMRRCRLPGQVVPEITDSMIELNTGVCAGHAELLAQLQEMRGALLRAADRLALGLCGGGTHPFQDWSERRISRRPRYQRLSELYGYLSKQYTVFGQHVHIGCADADEALRLLHGLSRYIPHLIALSAASPFVQGVDTGFDSARLNTVFAFPLSGRAPFLRRWDELERYFGKLAGTGIVQSMKDFYWDIRPKPEFGTIEVRVLDTPLTIEKAAALAGFVQCLARWLVLERPFEPTEDDALPYTYNRFQACRFGLDAVFVDPGSGDTRPLRDELDAVFTRLEGHAAALRAEDAIALLRAGLAGQGNDAAWIRRTQADERLLAEVVRQQVQRWAGRA